MVIGLAASLGGCSSGGTAHYIDTAELEAARTEVHQAQTAITSCLYEAGRAQLDSAVRAWDGGPDQVTCTVGAQTYDAGDYLHVASFKATYDVDLNGVITRGRNVSRLGVRWDPDARQWAPL
ncbi:MAG: hypothetical protein FJ020_03555 [Chloroflexi bacterium]|nr:hypothetical protein [Chloroflexota bacterium]